MRKRLIAAFMACLALTLGMIVTLTSAAQAADPSQCATDRQTAIDRQLTKAPGGKALDERTISYLEGKVLVTLVSPQSCGETTTMAKSDCPLGWLCFWEDPSFQGTRWQFQDEGYWQDLRQWGVDIFYSFYNHRADAFLLRRTSSSNVLCYNAEGSGSNVGTTVGGYRYIFLRQTAGC
ncbi:peptidase inhibitor family I36 protein [Nonomuraea sp. NPDC049625]|uniref:peptidase inhibitor family I36 protein n=1 Tax=Nonomuraea sp. NPDC049625 TaxID=3155775 RepID=UPI003438D57A